MEEFEMDGEKFTIIDGIVFDETGDVFGYAERIRPVPDADIALEYLQKAGKPAKKKRGPKGPRYTKSLSALLIEDGATKERASQVVETAKKWATKEGTPGLACIFLILQQRDELKKHEPGELWRAAELEGIAPDNTARNFSQVIQGGASSIGEATRDQIKKDLQE